MAKSAKLVGAGKKQAPACKASPAGAHARQSIQQATACKASPVKTPRLPEFDEEGERITYSAIKAAISEILKRVRVDRRWDIPYLAGYSRAGRTIFIDRNLPKTFAYRGRRVKIDPFLVLHEAVEIAMLDKLDIRYDHAHQIALLVERSAVQEAGIEWVPYHEFMLTHIRRLASKRLTRVPRNLNLSPYLDEEDLSLLHAMLPLMFKKWQKEVGRR
jgi:hypothetical protein